MDSETESAVQEVNEAIQSYKSVCNERRDEREELAMALDKIRAKIQSAEVYSVYKFRQLAIENVMKANVDKELATFYVEYSKVCVDDNFDAEDENATANLGTLESITGLMCTASDVSTAFCQSLCGHDACMTAFASVINARRHAHLQNDNEMFDELIFVTAMVVYNIVMHEDSYCICRIKELDFLDVIKPFIYSSEPRMRVVALLFLAYTTTEKEGFMFREQGTVAYLISSLEEALDSSTKRGNGYDIMELARGLEKLSKNDENKHLLVDNGILPLMDKMLQSEDEEEQQMALVILWSLSFDETNKQQIKKELWSSIEKIKAEVGTCSTVGPAVERTSGGPAPDDTRKSDTKNLPVQDQDKSNTETPKVTASVDSSKREKALSGLLWMLTRDQNTACTAPQPAPGAKQHVFISYNHEFKDTVIKIANLLKNSKVDIWIDTDNIHSEEDIMDAMATAVENASVIFICYSKKYKESPNCRCEAQYAHRLKKTIIPVLMEPQYKADGWLGLMIGEKFYYDFTGKHPFDTMFKKLLDTVGGMMNKKKDILSADKAPSKPGLLAEQPVVPATTRQVFSENNRKDTVDSAVLTWTEEDTKAWLEKQGVTWKGENKLTGESLQFLKELRREAPEFFYQFVKVDCGMCKLDEMMKFVRALSQL